MLSIPSLALLLFSFLFIIPPPPPCSTFPPSFSHFYSISFLHIHLLTHPPLSSRLPPSPCAPSLVSSSPLQHSFTSTSSVCSFFLSSSFAFLFLQCLLFLFRSSFHFFLRYILFIFPLHWLSLFLLPLSIPCPVFILLHSTSLSCSAHFPLLAVVLFFLFFYNPLLLFLPFLFFLFYLFLLRNLLFFLFLLEFGKYRNKLNCVGHLKVTSTRTEPRTRNNGTTLKKRRCSTDIGGNFCLDHTNTNLSITKKHTHGKGSRAQTTNLFKEIINSRFVTTGAIREIDCTL